MEISDRDEAGGPIDVYWGRYFEHVFRFDGPVEEQFAQVIRMVEEWLDDSWVFSIAYDFAGGRQVSRGRHRFPIEPAFLSEVTEGGHRIVFWSWKGTHDGQWPPPGDARDQ